MRFWLVAIVLTFATGAGLRAAERSGQVTFGGLPVPGATVTASRGDQHLVTTTDQQGGYRFADLADGVWTIRIEMLGFSTVTLDVTVPADAPPSATELTLLSFAEITRTLPPPVSGVASPTTTPSSAEPPPPGLPAGRTSPAGPSTPSGQPRGFQRADVNASNPSSTAVPAAVPAAPGTAEPALAGPSGDVGGDTGAGDLAERAADGLLVNGSVNNGAASPFAQLAAFGNNRRGARSLYNWGLGAILNTSTWDARPFSFTPTPTPKPSYADVQVLGAFGGPLKIPGVIQNRPNLSVIYQRTADHNVTTQSALIPTSLERSGDFSETLDGFGRPVTIIDPATGKPFPGNVIPSSRIAPQASALLGYYPQPNIDAGAAGVNFQTPILVATHQDSVQSRFMQPLSSRTQLFGSLGYQRTTTETTSLFGFTDASLASGLTAVTNWSHRFSPTFSLRLRYQLDRNQAETTPYFANRANVSGLAGIAGNDQEPANWGPPTLIFSSGLAGLTDVSPVSTDQQTHTVAAESLWIRGRHNVTFGGGLHRQSVDALAPQNPRGTWSFTGAATGSDFADFLLGIPHTSAIAFGNADRSLLAWNSEAYATDDWRLSPGITLNVGARWEYEAPMTERFGRLVNLDIAPGFAAASPVLATNPVGATTGQRYPDSLLRPDWRGVQPRVGLAWRPVPGSSLLIRAGYGIYRNTSVYQSIDLLLAQQPPLSTTFSVQNSAASPVSLAQGFVAPPTAAANTFAVDPNLRVGFAQNWQVGLQRDLPGSLTMLATYLGAQGNHLLQEILPNTYPAGAVNPCPACSAGFVYLTSNGTSAREAGQFELRRRLRNGLSATVQYTLSKATDDAGAFTGVNLAGSSIAQDWLHPEAERGPSNFDQRHLVAAQVQYTTGVGVAGGGLLTGVKGSLLKGWTVTSQLTAGSGLPLTPVYLTSVAGTGVIGSIRGSLTGAPPGTQPGAPSGAQPAGLYADPAAYAAPATGQWGTAGRNSIRGPAQFGLNAGVGRTFPWGDRLNLDWRFDATNVLNRVTYSAVNTIVGSPQFGLPTQANTMRRLQTTLRLRF